MKPPQSSYMGNVPFNRDDFLTGRKKTYFAPGQDPSVVASGAPYINPTDWVRTNYPLYMPQVIWLEFNARLAAAGAANASMINGAAPRLGVGSDDGYVVSRISNDVWFYDDKSDYYGTKCVPNSGGNHTSYTEPFGGADIPATTQNQNNLTMIERDRIVEVMNKVKSSIESLRPGRTWVRVVNWNDGYSRTLGDMHTFRYATLNYYGYSHGGTWSSAQGTCGLLDSEYCDPASDPWQSPPDSIGQVHADTGSLESSWTGYPVAGGSVDSAGNPMYSFPLPDPNYMGDAHAAWLRCPPTSSFVGTDFLSIYIGDPGDANFAIDTPDHVWAVSGKTLYNSFKNTAPKFVRTSSRLYHLDQGWGSWDAPWISGGGSIHIMHTHYNNYAIRKDVGEVDYGAQAEQTNEGWRLADHASFNNTSCIGCQTSASAFYDIAISEAHKDKIDIGHPGGSSMITEDYLKNLIADHFNFDLGTGRDKPLRP